MIGVGLRGAVRAPVAGLVSGSDSTEASPRERNAGHQEKRSPCAGPGFARWRTGVIPRIAIAAFGGWPALISGRLVRPLAVLGLVASSAGCILTKDLPDPALDVPEGYKAARLSKAADAPPTLDWWRGFRSRELTGLMEEAQTVNLDIAAATARFKQADAQARIAGAALLPALSGSRSGRRSTRTSTRWQPWCRGRRKPFGSPVGHSTRSLRPASRPDCRRNC